ncbi:hypothetical protein GQ42DRAFT_162531 [Ramicandelaber brevisporus]|nr:hypothetical protein GQ42DRAFT_162531 [Ramicandelaber brevisporus]
MKVQVALVVVAALAATASAGQIYQWCVSQCQTQWSMCLAGAGLPCPENYQTCINSCQTIINM